MVSVVPLGLLRRRGRLGLGPPSSLLEPEILVKSGVAPLLLSLAVSDGVLEDGQVATGGSSGGFLSWLSLYMMWA